MNFISWVTNDKPDSYHSLSMIGRFGAPLLKPEAASRLCCQGQRQYSSSRLSRQRVRHYFYCLISTESVGLGRENRGPFTTCSSPMYIGMTPIKIVWGYPTTINQQPATGKQVAKLEPITILILICLRANRYQQGFS